MSILPHFTVSFNALSAVLLMGGYRAVRHGNILLHRRLMTCALVSSTLFLATYVAHKIKDGTMVYPYHDWTKPVYLAILLPHVILAILMVPFILRGVWLAVTGCFMMHARLMRRVFPVWLYVSVTGVLVYLFLYAQPHFR